MGPPLWRRELDPRGAQRRGTDAGPMAGLNECAFNPLCVCGRGSSAPTRVCLDARICSRSRVSFGLEPATDGSGRCTDHLHRGGARTKTTPSTPLSPPAPRAGRSRGRPGACPVHPRATGSLARLAVCRLPGRAAPKTVVRAGSLCTSVNSAVLILSNFILIFQNTNYANFCLIFV